MALFTDGPINTLQDLKRYESSLLDVASVEQVDVDAKGALAQDTLGAQLLAFLLRRVAPLATDPFNIVRRTLGVSDVVVTEPLKRWHAFKCIELTYLDAYDNQLNDRYRGKAAQFELRALEASRQLFDIGVGLVWTPIPKPQSPLLTAVAGALAAADYYVRMTWLNAAGQESAASDVVALQTTAGTQLSVTPVNPPPNALSWNVYVGFTPEGTALQNSTPIPAGSAWVLTAALQPGAPVGAGQQPERWVIDTRTLIRG